MLFISFKLFILILILIFFRFAIIVINTFINKLLNTRALNVNSIVKKNVIVVLFFLINILSNQIINECHYP